MCPQGERFTQKKAEEFAKEDILFLYVAIMKDTMNEFVSIL